MQGGCREEEKGDMEESASLQEAEAAVNKAQQALHLSLPVADRGAGQPCPPQPAFETFSQYGVDINT